MDTDYYKPIFLPSAGLVYKPIAEMSMPQNSMRRVINEPFFRDSGISTIMSVLSKNVRVPGMSIYDLLFEDALFLWYMMMTAFINHGIIQTKQICKKCRYVNSVEINAADIEVKFAYSGVTRFKEVKTGDYKLCFRRHRVWELMRFSVMLEDYDISKISASDLMRLYLNGQDAIFLNKKNEPAHGPEEFDDIFEEMINYNQRRHTYKIMEDIIDPDFGMLNDMLYECGECAHSQIAFIFDPLKSSILFVPDAQDKTQEKLEENMALALMTKMIGVDDFMRLRADRADRITELILKNWKKFVMNQEEDKELTDASSVRNLWGSSPGE